MKCRKSYKDQEKYRVYRNNYNQRYYDKRVFVGNNYEIYSDGEIEMIMGKVLPDTELARLLGRSVRAIQLKRHKEKQREKSNEKSSEICHIISGTGAWCGS